MGAASNADVLAAGHIARLLQCALDSVVDEMERGPTRAFPRRAALPGHDKHGRMEGRLFGPALFPTVEHALAHDAHAGAVVRLFQDAVVAAGFAPVAKLQV